ncbi:sulfite oxidase [Acidiphilium multivorum AIU301]|uniref:Sulfite oxidase n=1 Tax=Acidiphilium multivorum (strain DSM 11245 / JCM 8867 / NBRC 100883 / AIU 301) TaxID=926570 RepID=F0IXG7_ACIMA|nr:sulfite oxidase [Acidiphilium multivorum AIU301]
MSKTDRRGLFRLGAAFGATAVATSARAATGAPPSDDPWSNSLGAGVDSRPYGRPSRFEKNVIRRYVPWLSPTLRDSRI